MSEPIKTVGDAQKICRRYGLRISAVSDDLFPVARVLATLGAYHYNDYIAKLEKDNAELREALRPFAFESVGLGPDDENEDILSLDIAIGDIRRVRAIPYPDAGKPDSDSR